MIRTPVLAAALGAVAVLAGCGPHFPMPMTASDLVGYGTGPALVAYLGQPDASPAVCDAESRGPHLTAISGEDVQALVDGLDDSRVPPEIFRRCAERLLRRPSLGASLLTRMGESYRDLLRSSELDRNPGLPLRLAALHALYLDRPSGIGPEPARLGAWTVELEKALAQHRLGAGATPFGKELLATFSLERGRWEGAPVTEATLDGLQAKGDEPLLRRFAARLPDEALRRHALRRVVRMHVAASAYPEVRQHAREVEDILMKHGRYALSPAEFPPVRGRLDAAHLAIDSVLVRQDIGSGTVKVLGAGGSVVPEVPLRGPLQIELQGVSRPLTLCGPPTDLDPTPCLEAGALQLRHRLVSVDRDGGLLFVDNATIGDLLPVARAGDLVVPMAVAGRELLSLRLGVAFERPSDLLFEDGPNLRVDVDARGAHRLVYTVSGPGRAYTAVVERPDVPLFHIESRGLQGASGYAGARGIDGAAGSTGMGASCPSSSGSNGGRGQDGTAGGLGGPGSPGGRGGDITVHVDCGGSRASASSSSSAG